MGPFKALDAFSADLLPDLVDLAFRVRPVQIVRQDDETGDGLVGAGKMQGERAAGDLGLAGLVGQEGDHTAIIGLTVGAVGDLDAAVSCWRCLEADPLRRFLPGARLRPVKAEAV